MNKRGQNLSDRWMKFAVSVVKLTPRFKNTAASRHIAGQLIRSATSSGANYEEAWGAESKKDFIHKMQIVLKELKESFYWLRLANEADIVNSQECCSVLREAEELVKNFAKSVVTTKQSE
ncbi:four helix bundle protein [candidate division WOR-3 bacterium]|nr:four helix bundle protein [candidate division WOR-3 bacterium]